MPVRSQWLNVGSNHASSLNPPPASQLTLLKSRVPTAAYEVLGDRPRLRSPSLLSSSQSWIPILWLHLFLLPSVSHDSVPAALPLCCFSDLPNTPQPCCALYLWRCSLPEPPGCCPQLLKYLVCWHLHNEAFSTHSAFKKFNASVTGDFSGGSPDPLPLVFTICMLPSPLTCF